MPSGKVKPPAKTWAVFPDVFERLKASHWRGEYPWEAVATFDERVQAETAGRKGRAWFQGLQQNPFIQPGDAEMLKTLRVRFKVARFPDFGPWALWAALRPWAFVVDVREIERMTGGRLTP